MLSAGNEIGVRSGRSARRCRPAKAAAATNLQQENDQFSPVTDDSSEPPSARIDAFGTGAFFSGPIQQHLQACSLFNEGVAKAVVAGAAACPDKAHLLSTLMASVESALKSLNIWLEMCEDRRAEEEAAVMGVTLENVEKHPAVSSVTAPMTRNTLTEELYDPDEPEVKASTAAAFSALVASPTIRTSAVRKPAVYMSAAAPHFLIDSCGIAHVTYYRSDMPTYAPMSAGTLAAVRTFTSSKWSVEITEISSAPLAIMSTAVLPPPPCAAPVPSSNGIAVRPCRLVQNAGDLLLDRLLHELSGKEWELVLHTPTLKGISRGSPWALAQANVRMQMVSPHMLLPEVRAGLPAQQAGAPHRDAAQMEEGLDVDELPWEYCDVVDWGVQGLPFCYELAAVDWSTDGLPGFDIGAINWNAAGVPL